MTDLIKATVEYSVSGSSVPNNVFLFEIPSGETDTDIKDGVFQWVKDVWAEEWKTFASTNAELVQVGVSKISTAGVVTDVLGTILVNITGLSLQPTLAAAVSAALFAGTDRPRSRGRKFIPGISEEFTSDGLFTAGFLGDLAVMLLAYYTPFSSGSGVLMSPGVLSTVTAAFLAFNETGGFDDIPDYQIRRRPDRGS